MWRLGLERGGNTQVIRQGRLSNIDPTFTRRVGKDDMRLDFSSLRGEKEDTTVSTDQCQ